MAEEIEEFSDKEGKKIRRHLSGGITEEVLIEPSEWYKENILKPIQQMQKRVKEQGEKEAKIQKKLREMAEKELEKEGKL